MPGWNDLPWLMYYLLHCFSGHSHAALVHDGNNVDIEKVKPHVLPPFLLSLAAYLSPLGLVTSASLLAGQFTTDLRHHEYIFLSFSPPWPWSDNTFMSFFRASRGGGSSSCRRNTIDDSVDKQNSIRNCRGEFICCLRQGPASGQALSPFLHFHLPSFFFTFRLTAPSFLYAPTRPKPQKLASCDVCPPSQPAPKRFWRTAP